MTGRMLLAGLTTLAALACGGGGSDSGLPTGNTGGGDITVGNNFFNPTSFSVAPGGTVTWAWNSGGTQHNVTFDDGQTSGNQGTGQYQRTFATAGSYAYHCTIHGAKLMSGTITVGTAGGTGGTGGGGGGGGGGYGG
jgi:plastocyanin